jgi:hypothetical protein
MLAPVTKDVYTLVESEKESAVIFGQKAELKFIVQNFSTL